MRIDRELLSGRNGKIAMVAAVVMMTLATLWWIEARQDRPDRYTAWIDRYAREAQLDPMLIEAMVFAESSRRSGVVSHKGAVGLMQLMPSTAREVGARLGMRNLDAAMLRDPELNLRLGIQYFAWLVERHESLELALAAYNAGPTRVSKWRREHPEMVPTQLIEEVAYFETRTYVARVLDRYAELCETK